MAGVVSVLAQRARSECAGDPLLLRLQRVDDARSRADPCHACRKDDVRHRWTALLSILCERG